MQGCNFPFVGTWKSCESITTLLQHSSYLMHFTCGLVFASRVCAMVGHIQSPFFSPFISWLWVSTTTFSQNGQISRSVALKDGIRMPTSESLMTSVSVMEIIIRFTSFTKARYPEHSFSPSRMIIPALASSLGLIGTPSIFFYVAIRSMISSHFYRLMK